MFDSTVLVIGVVVVILVVASISSIVYNFILRRHIKRLQSAFDTSLNELQHTKAALLVATRDKC